MSLQRLTALRALMASQPSALTAYIIPTADAHNVSKYGDAIRISGVDYRPIFMTNYFHKYGQYVIFL